MDENDILICQSLLHNSRQPYRVLAKNLETTVQTVHKRVQSLIEQGVIEKFTANPSVDYLRAFYVGVYGVSEAADADEIAERLRKNENAISLVVAATNHFFISGILRALGDLGQFIESIRKDASMPNPVLEIPGAMRMGRQLLGSKNAMTELSPLDFRIIGALHADSRKSINEIADELGISTKTVSRRLERMEHEGAISYSIEWNPGRSGGITAFITLNLKTGTERNQLVNEVYKTYGPRIIGSVSSQNDPSLLFFIVWSSTTESHRRLCDAVHRSPGVAKLNSYFIERMYFFEDWRRKLLVQGQNTDRPFRS